jgi:hypothetical protein
VDTVLRSQSKTVVIGAGQPFCIIGERINPTGRKAFQAQLQKGDLSQIEIDVAEQLAGADVLDVNVGERVADEVGLMGQAIPLVQGITDLPLCIDSSVIEALEAGLAAYEGKALVNSVTGEDERLQAILPIVARHGAAVIGLANDDEIRMEPKERLAIAKKIVERAAASGDRSIGSAPEVVPDPLTGGQPRVMDQPRLGPPDVPVMPRFGRHARHGGLAAWERHHPAVFPGVRLHPEAGPGRYKRGPTVVATEVDRGAELMFGMTRSCDELQGGRSADPRDSIVEQRDLLAVAAKRAGDREPGARDARSAIHGP